MPNPFLDEFKRVVGLNKRKHDIELEAEQQRDPRLPKPGKVDEVQRGIDVLRKMRAERKAYSGK